MLICFLTANIKRILFSEARMFSLLLCYKDFTLRKMNWTAFFATHTLRYLSKCMLSVCMNCCYASVSSETHKQNINMRFIFILFIFTFSFTLWHNGRKVQHKGLEHCNVRNSMSSQNHKWANDRHILMPEANVWRVTYILYFF